MRVVSAAGTGTSQKAQLSLEFEPGLLDMYPTAMDRLRGAVYAGGRPLKTLAADMDMGESDLSRKLAENPNDTRRFSLGDLEKYIAASGDVSVVLYLAQKYLQTDESRRAQVLAHVEGLLAQLGPALVALKGNA